MNLFIFSEDLRIRDNKALYEASLEQKGLIALYIINKEKNEEHGDSLAKIAEEKKVNLEYEASVCGGVPIVRSIKEGLLANKITKVYGILNGTSNFILSSMGKDDLSFKYIGLVVLCIDNFNASRALLVFVEQDLFYYRKRSKG